MEKKNSFFVNMTEHKDVFLLLVIVVVLLMMILPLPTFLMDIMITLNISAAILILLMTLQLRTPTQFSTFPSLLLVTTLFRLAISISTTRLILIEGDAGKIVETFGNVVISGNLVVGFVIFMIITVVQFLVITKGADRVAEVGARFTLDGMPGKQMSVDADVRAGNIDQAQAKAQRQVLEQETRLFGAMDGAMKFVKGDAMAGLVITLINLVGGIGIGMGQLGYSFGEAAQLYALLTIGDGLVAQIPALLISVAAGTMVTRVTNPHGLDLGTEIGDQISQNHRTMMLGGAVIGLFGFIPGFPTAIFVLVGAGLSVFAYTLNKRRTATPSLPKAEWQEMIELHNKNSEDLKKTVQGSDTIKLILPNSILNFNPVQFQMDFGPLANKMEKFLGIPVGFWSYDINENEETRFEIMIGSDRISAGEVNPDCFFVKANFSYLKEMDIPVESHCGKAEGCWVKFEHGEKLSEENISYHAPLDMILLDLQYAAVSNLDRFVTYQTTLRLLDDESRANPALIEDLKSKIGVDQLCNILKSFVSERIYLKSRTRVIEAILNWAPKCTDPLTVVQHVRAEIDDVISSRFGPDGFLKAIVIAPAMESAIRAGFRKADDESFVVLDSEMSEFIVQQVRSMVDETFKPGSSPVILTQQDIRRAIHNVLVQYGLFVPVLCYQEVTPDILIYPIGFISTDVSEYDQVA